MDRSKKTETTDNSVERSGSRVRLAPRFDNEQSEDTEIGSCTTANRQTMASNFPHQNPSTSGEPNTSGFGRFKLELADQLTQRIVVELATLFEYPRASLDELWNTEENVGQKMVAKMEERGEIKATDISPLITKLRIRKYDGVAEAIQSSFDEHVSVSTKFTDKTSKFVRNLRKGYRKVIDSVRPVPFQQLCRPVEAIFVESNLEKMEEKESDSEQESWQKMDSVEDMITDPRNRIILEGEPGFGKSTLMLHLASKWCASLMCLVDVLILLRLREVGNLSFFKAIERFILPKECDTSDREIQEILTSEECEKMLIILEGYDEFDDSDSKCDIISIINSSMFPTARVIITTRPGSLPKLPIESSFSRMRLGGFDESMQVEYIKKAISAEEDVIKTLIDIFRNNDLLSDICQTPLFFALFAHLLYDDRKLQSLQSVTQYVKYLIRGFFSHEMRKSGPKTPITEQEHERLSLQLAKVAFEGLKSGSKRLEWDTDDLNKAVDSVGYDLFKRVGVLIEESQRDTNIGGQNIFGYWGENPQKYKTKFFHKTFQEYYAALYILRQFEETVSPNLPEIFEDFNSYELRFMFLFTCGLDCNFASHVIPHIEQHYAKDREMLNLCLLETKMSHRLVPQVTTAVESLCRGGVSISDRSSKLLQRAQTMVLQIVSESSKQMPIPYLLLDQSFASAARDGSSLSLSSGHTIPSLPLVEEIYIQTEWGREIIVEEWTGILKYSQRSQTLKKLKLSGCLLPQSIPISFLSSSLSGVQVSWNCCSIHFLYTSDRWQNRSSKKGLTDGEYRKLVELFRRYFRDTPFQKARVENEEKLGSSRKGTDESKGSDGV